MEGAQSCLALNLKARSIVGNIMLKFAITPFIVLSERVNSLGDTSDVDAVKQAIEFDEIDRDATLTLGLKIEVCVHT